LRVVTGGAELWRVTESPGELPRSLKEADVTSVEETLDLLDEIGRALTVAGWKTSP